MKKKKNLQGISDQAKRWASTTIKNMYFWAILYLFPKLKMSRNKAALLFLDNLFFSILTVIFMLKLLTVLPTKIAIKNANKRK